MEGRASSERAGLCDLLAGPLVEGLEHVHKFGQHEISEKQLVVAGQEGGGAAGL